MSPSDFSEPPQACCFRTNLGLVLGINSLNPSIYTNSCRRIPSGFEFVRNDALGIDCQILGFTYVAFYYGRRCQVSHGKQWTCAFTVIPSVVVLKALIIMPASVKGAIDASLPGNRTLCSVHVILCHCKNLFKPTHKHVKTMSIGKSMVKVS